MVATVGPQDVLDAVRVARGALSSVAEPSGVRGSREEWAAVAGELQRLVNEATAVQDAAVVRLAAVEPQWCEDGTVVEVHKPLGHAALDAPSILSGVLNLTAVAAERRVRHALRTAADGPDGTESCTGLGGLHAAMAAGRLDAYRAQVVAAELEECPAEVAATVVASLDGWFDVEDGARLRRRARRLLARVSPDLLRQRAARARSESSLRRWVDQPGVDTWLGTFPSEEACRAWAAIDALAQRYVADGTCERVDRARAKALTDLVTGHATVDVQVVLTAPAAAEPSDGLAEVSAPGTTDPVLVDRVWLARPSPLHRGATARVAACDPVTGALVDDGESLATGAYRPGKKPHRAGQGPRRAVPVPRLPRRRPVLRPRPPHPLAGRPHHRRQPRLPLPPPPPHQATPRLDRAHPPRRHPHLDRPHRQDPHHPPHRPPPPDRTPRHRAATRPEPATRDPLPHPPRHPPQHPRTPARTPPRQPPSPPHHPHRHPRPHLPPVPGDDALVPNPAAAPRFRRRRPSTVLTVRRTPPPPRTAAHLGWGP